MSQLRLQDSDLYLLDDVLAALDAHVASWLITHAFCGPLLQGRACVAATNSAALTQRAHRVLHMRAGCVTSNSAGPMEQLKVLLVHLAFSRS